MSPVFSTPDQLAQIGLVLACYLRLPVSTDVIPGAFLESVLAHVRGGQVLRTYDFVDVIHPGDRVGWSIKSTKAGSPLTWKRVKIPNKNALIREAQRSQKGAQALGDAILAFCNDHARHSLGRYDLDAIGYARLIASPGGDVRYFERLLCTRDSPEIFDLSDFTWGWSPPKRTRGKEQLPAFCGTHRETGDKWWAWHGQSENQLHFSKETEWWPEADAPHTITFPFPSEGKKLTFARLQALLDTM